MSIAKWFLGWLKSRMSEQRTAAPDHSVRLFVRRLEDRQVLSVSAVLVGTDVTFTGDDGGASADSIIFTLDVDGHLAHNLGGINGFHSSIDLDNTLAGDQVLTAADITQLTVDLGADNDSVNFANHFNFAAGSLSVSAESISATLGSLSVQGLAQFDAGSANNIALLGSNDFQQIQVVSANNVFLNDINDLEFSGASTVAGDLEVTFGTSVTSLTTNEAGASLAVGRLASFSGGSIALGAAAGDTFHFGRLHLDAVGTASVEEDSGTELFGDVFASELRLASEGDITAPTANLQVTGLASFSGDSISVGNAATVTEFGSLHFESAGAVAVDEDTATELVGDNRALSLLINSAGDLTATGSLTVSTTSSFSAAGDVILNHTLNDFGGAVAVSGHAVELVDANALTLGQVDATAAEVTAGGQITLGTGAGEDLIATDCVLLHASSGGVAQRAGSTILTDRLALTGAGRFTLDQANDVNLLAVDISGPVHVTDMNSLVVGTACGVSGLTTRDNDASLKVGEDLELQERVDLGQGNLFIHAEGTVSQSATGAISASGLALLVSGTTTLNQTNDVDTLATETQGTVEFHDIDDLHIGVVSETASPAHMTISGASVDDADFKVTIEAGNITLEQEISTGAGDVHLAATTGSILDGQDGLTRISAHNLSLIAQTQIGDIVDFAAGTGDAIDASLTGVLTRASVTETGGEIFLNFHGDLRAASGSVNVGGGNAASAILRATGGGIDVGTALGVFSLSSGDNLALEAIEIAGAGGTLVLPDAGLDVGAGDLRLRGDVDVRDAADRNLGPLVADDLHFTSGAGSGDTTLTTRINTLTAQITSSGAGLTVLEADGLVLTAIDLVDGDLAVHASQSTAGDIEVIDVAVGDARITLDTTAHGGGQIVDADTLDDPNRADLTATEIDLRAGTGIAHGAKLEIAAERLAATTVSGQINVRDVAGDLTIAALARGTAGVSVTAGVAGDDICISTVGALTVDADVSNSGTGDREILLAADGDTADHDLTVNADITATDGNSTITLLAGDSILFAGTTVTSAAGTGAVQVRAGRVYQNGGVESAGASGGDIVMQDGSIIQSDNGTITLSAPNDIQLSEVNANADGEDGDIALLADADGSGAGQIREALSGESPNLIADHATLSAATGIGTAGLGDINTAVVSLDIHNTTSGAIQITDVDAVQIEQLSQSGGGEVLLQTSNGSITVDNDNRSPVAVVITGGGTLVLDAQGARSDVVVNDGIQSIGGDITLLADRNIETHSAAVATTGGDGDLTLVAGQDIRILDPGNLNPIDLQVTGSGTVSLRAANELVLGSQNPGDPNAVQHTTLNDVVVASGTGRITNTLPILFDVQSPQVTAEGEAVLSVTIGRPGETNLAVRVYWGDGTVETFTGLAAGTHTYRHFYTANPNPLDPAAPILVNVQVAHDPKILLVAPNVNSSVLSVLNSAIDIPPPVPTPNINADLAKAIYNPGDPLFPTLQGQIVSSPGSETVPGTVVFQDTTFLATTIPVPGEGLATFVFDTTPPVKMLDFPEGVKIVDTQPPSTVHVSEGTAAQLVAEAGEDTSSGERQVILEVISPTGEVIQQAVLPESTLDDLQAIIGRLPDGQYRFQLREAGEDRLRLLLEFEVRQGKIADETDAGDRPPSMKKPVPPEPMDPESKEQAPDPNGANLRPDSSDLDATAASQATPPPTASFTAHRAWKHATEMTSRENLPDDSDQGGQSQYDDADTAVETLGVVVAVVGAGWTITDQSRSKSIPRKQLSRVSRLLRRVRNIVPGQTADSRILDESAILVPTTSPLGEWTC